MSLKYLNFTGLSNLVTNIKNWVTACIPTKTSEITNDSGFITSSSLPTVNNATLTIQKNGTTVKTFTANASSNVTCNITVPTAVSELTNDSGFLTSHQSLSNYSTLANTVKSLSISGKTITVTPGSGSTYTLTTQDTVYTHPTTAGNKHIPSGGSSGQFLGWDSDGTAKWVNNPNTDTDTKVTQTVTTGNSFYPILTHATATATATATDTARFSKGAMVNARYGYFLSQNPYDTAALKGTRPTSTYLCGALIGRTYDGANVGQFRSEMNKGGYNRTFMQAINYITNGAVATDGTAISASIIIDVLDDGSKRISTDGLWLNNLTPITNNTYSLGTSSLRWKAVYSNSYYLGTAAFGDIVTHDASEFLTSHQSLSNYSTKANTVKSLSISGTTITVTPGSGSAYTLTTQDTVYTHPTSAGNKHIPSGGSTGQILRYSASGTAAWANRGVFVAVATRTSTGTWTATVTNHCIYLLLGSMKQASGGGSITITSGGTIIGGYTTPAGNTSSCIPGGSTIYSYAGASEGTTIYFRVLIFSTATSMKFSITANLFSDIDLDLCV